jgi:flagellar basal-body rod modification protein FlgD
MSTTAIGASGAAAPNTASTPSPTPASTDSLANETTFLQLLVAQLEHQDPLNPADGLQFVTQLAQFTSLEQSMQMRSDLDAIKDALTATKTTSAASDAPSTSGTNS